MLRYSRFGIAGALLHLAILAGAVTLILGSGGPGWQNYWMIFLALDFPVSLGALPVNWLVPPSADGPLRDPTNFWWPLLYHGLVGTGWWYIVGWAIERKVWRRAADDQGQEREDATGSER